MYFIRKLKVIFLAVNFVKLSIVFCKIDLQVIFKFERLIITLMTLPDYCQKEIQPKEFTKKSQQDHLRIFRKISEGNMFC
jgi:hypothetical protein